MMSSGNPHSPPHSPALATSNLWSQCLAALQSWLIHFPKKKKKPRKVDLPRWALGRDPPRVPQPPVTDTRVYPTLGAGGLVSSQPRCSLSKPGGLARQGPRSVRPDSDKQRPEIGGRGGGLAVNPCPKTWGSCSFYTVPLRAREGPRQQAGALVRMVLELYKGSPSQWGRGPVSLVLNALFPSGERPSSQTSGV